jgi:hypothetical protein
MKRALGLLSLLLTFYPMACAQTSSIKAQEPLPMYREKPEPYRTQPVDPLPPIEGSDLPYVRGYLWKNQDGWVAVIVTNPEFLWGMGPNSQNFWVPPWETESIRLQEEYVRGPLLRGERKLQFLIEWHQKFLDGGDLQLNAEYYIGSDTNPHIWSQMISSNSREYACYSEKLGPATRRENQPLWPDWQEEINQCLQERGLSPVPKVPQFDR